jgi:cyclic-di-GMP phosphodiesterase, flagellum assembly factor TipF
VTEFAIAAAYGILSAGLSWGLYRYASVDFVTSMFAGGVLALAMIQLRASVNRIGEARGIEEDIEALRASASAMRAELDDTRKTLDSTRKTMAQVTDALAKRSESQEKRMVGELQIIEGLIREFASRMAEKTQPVLIAADEPRGGAPVEPRAAGMADPALLELIRRSLEENRVDLYLQPVVSLPQRKVRFYEALTRLRSEDGAVIMPDQYIRVAAPAGLMSVVDNLLLFRCVQVVRRLTQKSRDIAVFCNISGHTLNDAEFFPQFLDFMHHHKDLASQIVFEFAEDAVLKAGPAQEANLRYLAGLGFRLSMDQVSKLDLDFARLKRLGFQFFKVRAGTLMSGMRTAKANVAAEDFKDHLSRNGINLIVERVEDEKAVVQLLEFNVDFGQGYLFGEPKPIREVGEFADPRVKDVTPMAGALPTGLARRLAS